MSTVRAGTGCASPRQDRPARPRPHPDARPCRRARRRRYDHGPSGQRQVDAACLYRAAFSTPAFSAAGSVLIDGRESPLCPPSSGAPASSSRTISLSPPLRRRQPRLWSRRDRAGRARDGGASPRRWRAPGLAALRRVIRDAVGGQRARVALLRPSLPEPRASPPRRALRKLGPRAAPGFPQPCLRSRAAAQGLPAVLVTHDIADAEASGRSSTALRRTVLVRTVRRRIRLDLH